MLPIFMLATILALSAMDYEHLARTIQVEAAKGTMDEYCVAVSVLNRVRSSKFPNTFAETLILSRGIHNVTNCVRKLR